MNILTAAHENTEVPENGHSLEYNFMPKEIKNSCPQTPSTGRMQESEAWGVTTAPTLAQCPMHTLLPTSPDRDPLDHAALDTQVSLALAGVLQQQHTIAGRLSKWRKVKGKRDENWQLASDRYVTTLATARGPGARVAGSTVHARSITGLKGQSGRGLARVSRSGLAVRR